MSAYYFDSITDETTDELTDEQSDDLARFIDNWMDDDPLHDDDTDGDWSVNEQTAMEMEWDMIERLYELGVNCLTE